MGITCMEVVALRGTEFFSLQLLSLAVDEQTLSFLYLRAIRVQWSVGRRTEEEVQKQGE